MKSEALPISELATLFNALWLLPEGRKHIGHCGWCRALKRGFRGQWELSDEQTNWCVAHLLCRLALHQV